MATNEIFYEKYRPKHLSHILGQSVAVNLLQRSCEKEWFHHSYLLSGKYGTGKTSIARLLAAMLVCENRKQGSSIVCHDCPGCRAAYGKGSPDVQELDAASNSGVENVRNLIEGSRYTPQDLKKRVIIIDEFHLLSTAAMKSLLKTLEEPPSTVVFILCTTEFQKVPPEIRSRCLNLFFSSISFQILSKYLGKLFASKKVEVEQGALDCLAKASRGSVRNALELSQEVMLLADGHVTEKLVTSLVGLAGREEVYSLVTAISDGNLLMAFDMLECIFESGVDPKTLAEELGAIFRNIMLVKVSKKFAGQLLLTEQEVIGKVESKFSTQALASILPIFEEAEKAFAVNVNSRWVLETVVVRLIDKITK